MRTGGIREDSDKPEGDQERASSVPTVRTLLDTVADRARLARNEYARRRSRGEPGGPCPASGTASKLLDPNTPLPAVDLSCRFHSRRERANELRERMQAFSAIYNGAWLLRDSFFGPDARRKQMAESLLHVFAEELRRSEDFEACLFALADSIMLGSHGVPWEP